MLQTGLDSFSRDLFGRSPGQSAIARFENLERFIDQQRTPVENTDAVSDSLNAGEIVGGQEDRRTTVGELPDELLIPPEPWMTSRWQLAQETLAFFNISWVMGFSPEV